MTSLGDSDAYKTEERKYVSSMTEDPSDTLGSVREGDFWYVVYVPMGRKSLE